jgi:hypothetical protein
MNFANIERSARLQKTFAALKIGTRTTAELQRETGSMAVHTDIAELRANGKTIKTQYVGRIDGRKIYSYTLEDQSND